ncbi:MAG: hypothetical protein ACLFV0_11340 [Nitriliruptoraceae bacterium]
MSTLHYDVVLVTDARLPGGTTASVAEEIRAQARAGFRTGLIHVPSPLVAKDRPFAPRLRAAIEAREVDLLAPDATVTTPLAVLRHPIVGASVRPELLPHLEAAERLVIANQAPRAGTGAIEDRATGAPGAGEDAAEASLYLPSEVEEVLGRWWGGPARWAPIGPLVREDLLEVAPDLRLEPEDWVNVIDVASWRRPRSGSRHRVPVIGRHSRDHPLKWPATATELLDAYPDTSDVEVHVLGGAAAAARILGGAVPERWLVEPFGALPPARFLAGLDVYVYQHHPDWVEAFGRSILEALASGLPTVLPPHFAPLFGEVPRYATPAEVQAEVRLLHEDRGAYRAAAEAGIALAEERFGHGVHVERLRPWTEPSGPEPVRVPAAGGRTEVTGIAPAAPRRPATDVPAGQPRDGSPVVPPSRQRVLFVSSNGAGVGHLMRLLSYARRASEHVEPLFLTFSQGGRVVDDAGYLVEYLASRAISGARSVDWHAMLRGRVGDMIERHDVRALVFDGVWPYQGLFDAAEDHPHVCLVWSRRAMWRPGITNPVLEEQRDRFDLVLEPGELAAEDDRGATRAYRDEAVQVGPVTYLDEEELLDRDAARAALELDPERPAALVHLGAGNIDDTDSVLGQVVARLACEPDLQVLVTRSIIAERQAGLPVNVRPVSIYPLARYLAAFDLAVAAAGYNSFHELTLAAVPTAFVPNLVTAADDQAARSAFAQRAGIGLDLRAPSAQDIDQALTELLDPDRREGMRRRARELRPKGGAAAGMAAIETLLERGPEARIPPRQRQLGQRPSASPATPARPHPQARTRKQVEQSPTARPAAPARPPSQARTRGQGGKPPTAGPGLSTRRSLAQRLRAFWVRARRQLAAWLQAPAVRRFGGRVFATLPEDVRRATRRRLRRWERRPAVHGADTVVLPVPAGRLLPPETLPQELPVALVALPPLGDAALVDVVVDRLAQLQRARGGFAPVLVLGDLAFGAARRAGYLVEYLPPPAALRRLEPSLDVARVRQDRLQALVRLYRPDRVIALPAPEEGDLAPLLGTLAAGLEGLDRPVT